MAIDFERSASDFVDFGASSALQNVSGGSLSTWLVIESSAGGTQFYANLSTSTRTAGRLSLRQTALQRSALGIRLDGSAPAVANGGAPVLATLLHLVAVANYSTRALAVYINGALAGTGTLSDAGGNTSNTPSANVSVGALATAAPAVFSNFYDGLQQDVRVFNRALDLTEIKNLHRSQGRDSIVYGQQHRWKMNQLASGEAASDTFVYDTGALSLDGLAAPDPLYQPWIVTSRRRRHH